MRIRDGFFGLIVSLGLAAKSGTIHATDGVVGPGNCDEAGFASVLATVDGSGGGTITFDCGDFATIAFTNYQMIAHAVTIDGGDAITFDGGHSSSFFQVLASANVTLTRLSFTNGDFNGVHPLENFGMLTLDRSFLYFSGDTDSAILNQGTLVMRDSRAFQNFLSGTASGTVIYNDGGDVTITGTQFDENSNSVGLNGMGGAIATIGGTLTVGTSTFQDNAAFDGGAIYIGPGSGAVRIDRSTFDSNFGGYAGAIETWGADVQVTKSKFTNNRTNIGDGGAIWSVGGQLVVDSVEFDGNMAVTTGGGISCYGDVIDVINSTFWSNTSGTNGGGIFSTCAFSMLNVTFNANSAVTSGGALYQNGALDSVVTFATIDGNSASFGAGLYNEGSSAGLMHVGNSIVSTNPGGNCDGTLVSDGYNLSDDMGCGGVFTGPGDLINVPTPLKALGNYRGWTQTQPPEDGNPAIDHVPIAACGFPSDERGAPRPFGPGCDSGAVEVGGVFDDTIFEDGFDLD